MSRCVEVLVDQGVGISAMGGDRSLRVGDLGVAWMQYFAFKRVISHKTTLWFGAGGNMCGNVCALYCRIK